MKHMIKDQAGNMVTEMALVITLLTLMLFLGVFVLNYITKDMSVIQDLKRLTTDGYDYNVIKEIGISKGGY